MDSGEAPRLHNEAPRLHNEEAAQLEWALQASMREFEHVQLRRSTDAGRNRAAQVRC